MTKYEPTKSFAQKHPAGGYLRFAASPNGLGAMVTDTRRLSGKRRSVKGLVFNRGAAGWEAVLNPGENYKVIGTYPTMTADAAWELAVSQMN